MKGLHIYGVSRNNAGDNALGPASKWWLETKIFNNKHSIEWESMSCRKKFTPDVIDYINSFDCLLIGGGGLFLPDTNPNKTSCWQWAISNENLNNIKIPIYVCAVGYNLFYNQTVCMPRRNKNSQFTDPTRLAVFKSSVETLINKSEYFSMRHRGDIDQIKKIVDVSLHDKIKFEFCPTVEYSKTIVSHRETTGVWAYEIKDDRPQRRYHKVGREKFYEELFKFVEYVDKHLPNIQQKVLMHEGSNKSFLQYIRTRGYDFNKIPSIKNYMITPERVVQNISEIDVLFAMAGHSQMIGSAVSGRVISLISHDKLKYFLEDTESYTYENYVDLNNDTIFEKLTEITLNEKN
jgi:hypothetical protein